MFSLHNITIYIILFFFLCNEISENGTITNKWFVRKKRYFDVKIVRFILKTNRLSLKDINEISYNKLKYTPFIFLFIGIIIQFIFKSSKLGFYISALGALFVPILLIGLTSMKKIVVEIKKGAKNIIYMLLLATIAFFIIYFNGDIDLLKQLFFSQIQELGIENIEVKSILVSCQVNIDGYNRFSFIRASDVVNCQFTPITA